MKQALRVAGVTIGFFFVFLVLTTPFWGVLIDGYPVTVAFAVETLFLVAMFVLVWSLNSLMDFLYEML